MTIGEYLKKERLKTKDSIRLHAARIGISASMLWRYENGKVKPTIKTLKKISHRRGYSFSYMVELIKNEELSKELEVF